MLRGELEEAWHGLLRVSWAARARGANNAEIAELTGVSLRTAERWAQEFRKGLVR